MNYLHEDYLGFLAELGNNLAYKPRMVSLGTGTCNRGGDGPS
jgi:hypothetical protein